MHAFATEFNQQAIRRINESTGRIVKCMEQLDESEIWKRSNDNTNSMGNIILHLCGNIRQYIISSLGQVEDIRERDKEFSARSGVAKSVLVENLSGIASRATAIISSLDEEQLMKSYSVQGNNLSGLGIILHVTEHYSYHTGQVAFFTKQLKNTDLGFFANMNLNTRNVNNANRTTEE